MGYFSNYTPDSNPTGLFERSVCSYPSRLETLNYYLDDLTSALETVDQNRPHNQLHPEYDRCFYSSGRYRYYEVLWAEQVSVQDLLAAIAEVQELIRNAEQEAAETVDNNGDIPGQIAMVGFFIPLHSIQGYVPYMEAKTLWRRWNITILQYHVLPKFRETGIRLQIALQI
ncbi:MAG: hypothetical protein V8T09_07820 [Oscillospiraceae bacterium]